MAAFRKANRSQQANDGQIDKRWKGMCETVLEEGHFTLSFTPPDFEAEMTRVREEFSARLTDF